MFGGLDIAESGRSHYILTWTLLGFIWAGVLTPVRGWVMRSFPWSPRAVGRLRVALLMPVSLFDRILEQ